MSRVVSFRMDENDPTERQALEVLDRLLGEGFEVRQIMTEALLRAADMTPTKPESADPLVAELRASLLEARQLAGQLSTAIEDVRRGLPPPAQPNSSEQSADLKPELVTAMLRAKKPGLKR